MSEQQKFNWSEVQTETAEDREFMTFDENGEMVVKFEENDPFWSGVPKESKFNSTSYMFKVEGMIDGEGVPAIFSTSAKRCIQELAKLRPLKNKTVMISRTGSGIDTQFKAEKL